MKALFLSGVPDSGKANVVTNEQGGMTVVISGSSNLLHNLKNLSAEKHQFILAGAGGDQRFALNFFPDIIVNEISDPDSHRHALARCINFCQQQAKPVLNRPEAILNTARENVVALLQGIPGLTVPKTVRVRPLKPDDIKTAVEQSGLHYPIIMRAAGDHGGISTVRLEKEQGIERASHFFALDGRDYYLTQFVDYQSADGYYRKYRVAVVDGVPWLRHLIIADQWLIHADSRVSDGHSQTEEAEALECFSEGLGKKLQAMITAITKKIGLDYYGIDCHIDDNGEMLVFEVNANMNILINTQPAPNIWEQPIAIIAEQLQQMIVSKSMQSVSTVSESTTSESTTSESCSAPNGPSA